ncbi:hypothetical protein T09_124, partial [Trichinella sp. T9]
LKMMWEFEDGSRDVAKIRNALENLYSTSVRPEQRRAAHDFLVWAQSIPGNWQHFLTILKTCTDPNTAFFACNSLYSTLAFGWHNAPELEGYVESFFDLFVKICESDSQKMVFLANKICSTLAVCMLRGLMVDLGPVVVENLQLRWADQRPQLLVTVFEELPVQLDKITVRLEERSFLRASLHRLEPCIVSTVQGFLQSFYQRGFDPVGSLKLASGCAEIWLGFTKNIDAWKENIDSFLLSMLDINGTVLALGRLFGTLARQEKLRDHPDMLFHLFEYVGKIRVRLFNSDWSTVMATEFEHPVTVLMDMVSTLAEHHVQFMLRHVDDARVVDTFETLIAMFNIPVDYLINADYSCVVMTSAFWESLNYQLYHEIDGTAAQRNELVQRLAGFYVQLLSALLKQWHAFALKTIHVAPTDHSYQSCEDAFQSLICCCYNVLGNDVLAQLRHTLQEKVCSGTDGTDDQQQRPLSSAENDAVLLVLLSALEALSEEVAEHDDQIGVVLHDLLPLVPRHTPKMLCALLDVLVTYSAEIHHQQLYDVAVPIVLEGLRHVETATAASHALNEITCHREPVILPWADALLEAALGFADRSELQLQDRQSAMRSVGHIVGILPDDKRNVVITATLAPRLAKLNAIFDNNSINPSCADAGLSSPLANVFVEFSLLTHFTNSVSLRNSSARAASPYRHPACIVIEQCYPAAMDVYQNSGNSADVAHWVCTLVDASLVGLVAENALQTVLLVGRLVQSVALCKGLITLVQNCIMIIGEEEWRIMQLSCLLSEMFDRITGSVLDHFHRIADEDLLETYLRMCHKLSVNCWWFCSGSGVDMRTAMDLAKIGMQCSEIHVVRSTKLFLTTVFVKQKHHEFSRKLVEHAGPGILIECFKRNLVEPLGQNVEALGDIFAALVRHHSTAVCDVLTALPQHQIVSELLAAAVNNSRQFSTTWKEINILCRKGTLKLPVSITETTMK